MRKKSISLTYNDDEDWRLIVMRDSAMRYEADAIPENLVGASTDLCFVARPLCLTTETGLWGPSSSDLPNYIVDQFEWSEKFIDVMFWEPAYLIIDEGGRGRITYAAASAAIALLNGEHVYYAFPVCAVAQEAVGQ